MVKDIDTRVKLVYKLAKAEPDNKNLCEAVEVIKTLRRSQGQLAYWSQQHIVDKKQLKGEIIKLGQDKIKLKEQVNLFSQEKEQLAGQVTLLSQNIEVLKSDLVARNQEMNQLTQEKQRIIAQRDKVIAELKNIETEVEIATKKVQETTSLYGKFTIIWTLVQSLFFSNEPQEMGKIDNRLPNYADQDQMKTDQASINRNLLDK